ncbi:MAG TPA: AMP-dependent synthetase/ligase [bacterium]|nr:AMP-dependent synthetase/ligase [bacterium]
MASKNLVLDFQASVARLRHRTCWRLYHRGRWVRWSWLEVWERVRDLALGLKVIGVEKCDRVAILAGTRAEWSLADLAVLSLGAVSVPIYPSSTPEQVAFILNNSGAKAVFVEDRGQFRKIAPFRKRLQRLQTLVLMEGSPAGSALTLDRVLLFGRDGHEEAWQEGFRGIGSGTTATIVYTSGTTGDPKGAVITHGSFLKEVEAFQYAFDLGRGDTALFFLPLAHIFARALQFWQLASGFEQAYARGLDAVPEDLKTIRPHFTASVPRVFEKFREKIQATLKDASRAKRILLGTAPFLLSRKIRGLFGGRLRYAVSGGAPLSQDLALFFDRHGVRIFEGYGLTETTAGICINTQRDYRFGTVGRPVPGTRIKIAGDGEILVKSPLVFRGYYGDPAATRKVFTKDGWFKTGDVGEFDRDGFLKITDRKKDLIITAAGKNIAPQNIENLLKTTPYISQAMVHGDRRKFLSALVTLNREAVGRWMERRGVRLNGHRSPGRHPEVHRLIRRAVEETNKRLASYETIKKFAILDQDFSQEGGELTPTLKLKRKKVVEKYGDVLDRLYL